MKKKYWIGGGIALVVLLSLIGNLTGKIKIMESEKSELLIKNETLVTERDEARTALQTATAEAAASRRSQRRVARNPDGTAITDAAGNPVFETDEESSSSSSSASASSSASSASAHARSALGLERAIFEKTREEERPAAKRFAFVADIGRGGDVRLGPGFNQDLVIFEATVFVTNPAAKRFSPRLGLMLRR